MSASTVLGGNIKFSFRPWIWILKFCMNEKYFETEFTCTSNLRKVLRLKPYFDKYNLFTSGENTSICPIVGFTFPFWGNIPPAHLSIVFGRRKSNSALKRTAWRYFKLWHEAVMLTIDDTTNCVTFVQKVDFNPEGLKCLVRALLNFWIS